MMALGVAWGGDTSGDTPLGDRELQSPVGLPFPHWDGGCGRAFGGGWDKAAASERGLNDSVFGGCCII